jgi:hypothetical protein
MLYNNGNEYRGEFYMGVKEGIGRFFDNDDKSLYEGSFKNDKFNGQGKYTFSDGK